MNTQKIAEQKIAAYHGTAFKMRYHNGQIMRLKTVLDKHPSAILVGCSDERTGQRFGNAKCRAGRAAKIGQSTFFYQLWAVWEQPI